MRIAHINRILPAELPDALPLHLEQRASRFSNSLKLCLLIPAVALLYPFVLLGWNIVVNAEVRTLLASDLGLVLTIGLALAFWTVFFAWPLKNIIVSYCRSRSVRIGDGRVRVIEEGLFGCRIWEEPVARYTGLAHHVRTSLSGTRHELILTHPDRERSILIAAAPNISQAESRRVCKLLGRAEISSRELYNVGMSRDRRDGAAEPQISGVPV